MKVIIANSHVPGSYGGAEELANNLVVELNARKGVEARLLRVPFDWQQPEKLLTHIMALRNLNFDDADLLIPLKFPVYFLQARRRAAWIVHQFRQAYDMHGGPFTYFDNSQRASDVHCALIEQDNIELPLYDRLFTNSTVTQQRLFSFNGIKSDVLHAPVNNPERFTADSYEDFIFVGGRINPSKRQKMVLEAMATTAPDIRVVIAGPSEDPDYLAAMRSIIVEHNLEDRVTLKPYFLPRDDIIHYNNTCLAAVYLPVDEDSFGYVAMEAGQSSKATVTFSDTGGVAQLVDDPETGYVTPPNSEALGEALQKIWKNHERTRAMGKGAHEKLQLLGLTWDRTLEVILS